MTTELVMARLDPQALIARAIDAGAGIETMERLVALAKDVRAELAREAWYTAMSDFQRTCPSIKKTATAKIATRTGPGYCVAPETLVLTSGLRWLQADTLDVGSELVGVDEYTRPGRNRRRLGVATIEHVRRFTGDRVRVATERGDVLVTPEHPLLVYRPHQAKGGRWVQWIAAVHVRSGDEVYHVVTPWTEDRSDSWLAGMYDGEGSFVKGRGGPRGVTLLSVCQKDGPVLDRILEELRPYVKAPRASRGHAGVRYVVISSIDTALRVLGTYRPVRLLGTFDAILRSGRLGLPSAGRVAVVSVTRESPGPMVGLQTSMRTLVTNGLVSHNSYRYAPLDEIMAVIQPVMGPLGLSVSWRSRFEPGQVIVSCRVSHTLGHHEESGDIAMPIVQGDGTGATPPQRVGIAATYAKRYALLGIIGMAPEDDDDAQSHEEQPAQGAATDEAPRLITEPQAKRFYAIARGSGWTEEQTHDLLASWHYNSAKELSVADYDRIIEKLKARPPKA